MVKMVHFGTVGSDEFWHTLAHLPIKYRKLLEILKEHPEGLYVKEIVIYSDIPRRSVCRFLADLKNKNLVKNEHQFWRLAQLAQLARGGSSRLEIEATKKVEVRGHGFQFTIVLPKDLRNWKNRREILRQKTIWFKELNSIYGGAEKLEFKGRQIILTNKSIIIYESKSYFSQLASESRQQAINELKLLIVSLATMLHADFGSQVQIKVSKQHYALVQNALARQYNADNKELKVFGNDGKLWLIIDNSLKLEELETLHTKTAVEDNKIVQDFFNNLKKYPNFTPDFIMEGFKKIAENQEGLTKNQALQLLENRQFQQMFKDIIDILNKIK